MEEKRTVTSMSCRARMTLRPLRAADTALTRATQYALTKS